MKQKIGWQAFSLLLLSALSIYLLLPNFTSSKFLLSSKRINLGLDLKGGSYILMQVDFKVYMQDKLYGLDDEVKSFLIKENIKFSTLTINSEKTALILEGFSQSPGKLIKDLQNIGRDIHVEEQNNKIFISYTTKAVESMYNDVIYESINNVQRRLDKSGTKEIILQRQGKDKISLQVPGVKDLEQVKSLLGKTAKLTFHLLNETHNGTKNIDHSTTMILKDTQGVEYPILRRVELSGNSLTSARSGVSSTGRPVVHFKFNAAASKKFATLSRDNVNKMFAIVLDNNVLTAPRIREPILGGQGEISGNFTIAQADELALLLRAGALPAPLRIVEERTVGPSLGAESIRDGKMAAFSSIVLVSLFMILTYGLLGLFATIGLIFNGMLILLVLTLLQSTLTLPGIAGIALTFGMSVDANVLIFERIREELKLGKKVGRAVEVGFKHAMSTILDSNITTIIAALLMFMIGSGPISGFAVTLAVGILCSMFSAIVVTKLLIQTLLYFCKVERVNI